MKKPKWIKCSHKAIEWRNWVLDGQVGFPPQRFCYECEDSKKLKHH